ncbi:putative bifunctional diguanylate cyclase/phosphodiesterase [Cellvibrio mixtus]|uniref:putative bifunctional diguanylate cyclase/phosphodiesterase n=1 Tax=Cellvibrio mixtus TaxID=39650 RepID=UPI000587C226|nr:EAL domain-containing protein [Cellvibrio mixtus]
MKCPAIFPNEPARLAALANYGLDEKQGLQSLEPVVKIASRMFDMPVSAVNMIGNDHVFFAASTGVGEVDMDRDVSFCAHAINQNDVMVVPDARIDDRFHDNPLVTGATNLRFYAGVPLHSPEGLALGALCIIDDKPHYDFSDEDRTRLKELSKMVSDRLELQRIKFNSERERPDFENYAASSSTPVIWFDEKRRIIEWNEAAIKSFGYERYDKNILLFDKLIAPADRPALNQLINQAIAIGSLNGLQIPTEINGRRQDAHELHFGFSLFCWKQAGQIKFEAILKDLTEHQREKELLQQQANQDALTGLANRARFYRAVEDTVIAPLPATVFIIDLDGFKDINDTLGHRVGDEILREIARRLNALVDENSTLARMGGDEFAMLIPNLSDAQKIIQLTADILRQVAQPLNVYGQLLRITASCGIASAPAQAQEAMELVGDADLALFKAKRAGRGQYFLFTADLRAEAVARRRYGLELHRAVDEGEFLLFYQPQINLATGKVTGAEALIRWNHPKRGLLAPAAFLPALEAGPLAATVGSWVINEACAQTAYWRRNGAADFRMGINLFSAQFRTGDLFAEIIEALDRHGLPPQALELEVTENIVLDNDEIIFTILERLRNYGLAIAFDDFGTGYASLSLLKTYPLTRIKIDRSFVQNMLTSKRDAAVVGAILDMAHSFNLETIAEGIETNELHIALLNDKCDEGQGYLYGKPMPALQFEKLLGITRTRAVAS